MVRVSSIEAIQRFISIEEMHKESDSDRHNRRKVFQNASARILGELVEQERGKDC